MKTESPEDSEVPTNAQAAEKIALEASSLARLADSHQFRLLAHLIDMAVLEAWRLATEPETTGSDTNSVAELPRPQRSATR